MKSLVSLDFVYIYILDAKNVIAKNCDSFNMLKKGNLKFGCTPLTAIL